MKKSWGSPQRDISATRSGKACYPLGVLWPVATQLTTLTIPYPVNICDDRRSSALRLFTAAAKERHPPGGRAALGGFVPGKLALGFAKLTLKQGEAIL